MVDVLVALATRWFDAIEIVGILRYSVVGRLVGLPVVGTCSDLLLRLEWGLFRGITGLSYSRPLGDPLSILEDS